MLELGNLMIEVLVIIIRFLHDHIADAHANHYWQRHTNIQN